MIATFSAFVYVWPPPTCILLRFIFLQGASLSPSLFWRVEYEYRERYAG
jgi:hypothetical protein